MKKLILLILSVSIFSCETETEIIWKERACIVKEDGKPFCGKLPITTCFTINEKSICKIHEEDGKLPVKICVIEDGKETCKIYPEEEG